MSRIFFWTNREERESVYSPVEHIISNCHIFATIQKSLKCLLRIIHYSRYCLFCVGQQLSWYKRIAECYGVLPNIGTCELNGNSHFNELVVVDEYRKVKLPWQVRLKVSLLAHLHRTLSFFPFVATQHLAIISSVSWKIWGKYLLKF